VTRLSGRSVGRGDAGSTATSLFFYITVPDTYALNITGLVGTSKKKVSPSAVMM
jgi:hypothetical protein